MLNFFEIRIKFLFGFRISRQRVEFKFYLKLCLGVEFLKLKSSVE